jgi:hypothetical protein
MWIVGTASLYQAPTSNGLMLALTPVNNTSAVVLPTWLNSTLRIVALSRLSGPRVVSVAAVRVDPAGEDVGASAFGDFVGDVLAPCA